jgi:hypothetical protein
MSEERTKGKAAEQYGTISTIELIEGLLAKEADVSLANKLSFVQDVDEKTAGVIERDRELGRIAVSLCKLKNHYLLLHQVFDRKLTGLLRSMIRALEEDDLLLFALCSRALMELAASLSCVVEQTNEALEGIEDAKEVEPISEGIEELCGIYQRRLYATRFFDRLGMVDAASAPALVDQYLSADIENARAYYDYLSDFVHPGFDSSVLVSTGESGTGVTEPSVEEKGHVASNVLQIAVVLLGYLDRRIESLAWSGMAIETYVQRALHPAVTLSSLFAESAAAAGLEPGSEQTATFFTREGRVWLKLGDGTSFETPFKSIGDVTPRQEVSFSIKDGKIWVSLDDGTSFETPLESFTSRQTATFFIQAGQVWIRLRDGTSFETPLKSIEDAMPERKITLHAREGRAWVSLEDGTSFETPVESVTSSQNATFFTKDAKVWLRLGDGTSFETPLQSIPGVSPEQRVTLFSQEGKVWLRLDDGTSFETPLGSVTSRQTATLVTKGGKVCLRLADGTHLETPFDSIEDAIPEQKVRLTAKEGKIWLSAGGGVSFETPLTSIGRQLATFFDKEGKVWLRLSDGTSFETPLQSIGDVTPRQAVMLFNKKGKMWLRLDRGISFETPITYTGPKQTSIFFNKKGKVWLRT